MEQVKKMRKDFEKAVSKYVTAFLEAFELDPKDCWWVGDRVGLDLFCFGDMYAMPLEEMVYIVENKVTLDEYLAYIDYCEKCAEFRLNDMNLRSWHEGAPRIPEYTFNRLGTLKKNIEDLCKEANASSF